MSDVGLRIADVGLRMLDVGCRMLDVIWRKMKPDTRNQEQPENSSLRLPPPLAGQATQGKNGK